MPGSSFGSRYVRGGHRVESHQSVLGIGARVARSITRIQLRQQHSHSVLYLRADFHSAVDVHIGVRGPIRSRALMMPAFNMVPIRRLGRPSYVHPRPMRA